MARRSGKTRPRRRRWRRRILIGLVVLVIGAGALVALAPMIASGLAPGPIAGLISSRIPGDVDLDGVSLSWRGPQRVESARLDSAGGERIADISLEADTSLLDLVRGSRDLGEVVVGGEARIEREADGTTNLERALGLDKKRPAREGGRSEPARLPGSLEGKARLDELRVTWVDAAADVEAVAVLAGEGAFSSARGASFDLSGTLSEPGAGGAGGGGAAGGRGRVQLSGTITNLTDQQRRLTPAQATVDVALEVTEAPSGLIDSIASLDGQLSRALGEWVTVSAAAQGRMEDLRANVEMSSPTASAQLAVRTEGERVSLSEPGVIEARGPALLESWPQLREMIGAGGQLELLEAPGVTIEIASGSARLPADGAGFDLGAIALEATVRSTPAAARLAALEEGGAPMHVRTRAIEVRVAAAPLSAGVRAEGTAGATLDDRSAGELRFSVQAQPLDGEGRVQAQLGDLDARGEVSLTGFETRIAQPFVEEFGVRLSEDLGPTVDVVVRAAPGAAGATAASLSLRSQNVTADGAATIAGELVTLTDDGVSVQVAQAGPLADRLLRERGVAIEGAEAVRVRLARGQVDLGALRLGDYRGLGALAEVSLGPVRGSAQVAEQQRTFQTGAVTATLETADLAQGASLEFDGVVAVDGQDAGEVELTASAGDLLGPAGELKLELPRTLAASGALRGMSTALAQPFAAASGLDLPQDIGPAVDVQFDARPQGDVVALQFSANSEKAEVAATGRWNGRRLTLTGEGAQMTLREPGALLARLAPPDSGLSAAPGGAVHVQIPRFSAALTGGIAPERATGRIVVTVQDVAMRTGEGPPVRADQVVVQYQAVSPTAARLEIEGRLRHGQAPFSVDGAFNLASPLAPVAPGDPGAAAPTWAERVVALRPAGDLTIRDLPPSLGSVVSLLAPADAEVAAEAGVEGSAGAEGAEAAPLDLASLIEQVTEGPLTIALGAMAAGDDGNASVRLTLSAEGGPTRVAAAGDITAGALRLHSASVDARLEPGLIRSLSPESPARLAEAAPVRVVVSPVVIPLTEAGGMDFASAGEFAVEITSPGRALVEGLTVGGEGDEPARELPPVGARGLNVRLTAPGSAVGSAGGSAGEIAISGATEVVTTGDRVVAQAEFGATAQTSGGRLSGDPSVSVTLRQIDALFLDELAGAEALVSGATGGRIAEVALEADGRMGSAEGEPAFDVLRATLAVRAQRLTTSGPIRLAREGGALTLESPVELQWRAVPGWTNRYVARAPQGGEAPAPQAARFSAPAEVAIRLERFAIGPPGALLAPDRFALEAAVSSERVGLMTGSGEDVSFTDVAINVTGGEGGAPRDGGGTRAPRDGGGTQAPRDGGGTQAPRDGGGTQVRWDLQAQQSGAERGAIRATGALTSLADGQGALTTDQAALTLDLEAPQLRSAAVDSIIRQGGLIHAMMGETMSVSAHLENFSSAGGTVQASAESPRATLALEGRVEEGALVISGPTRLVTLREITPELSNLIAPSLPQIARFEKRPEDEEAYVDQSGLRFPLDGDLSKLNGDLTIALGQAQFQTSSAFARLLKTVQAESQAMVGRRLEPLVLKMRDGVVTYDRFQIPLGEFNLETSGTVDLPARRLDVVTWIPIGALTDEAAGMFNTGLGSLLGRAVPEFERLTMAPWRTRGTFGDTQTLPAPGMFVENVGGRLLRPDRILRDAFRDYLPGGGREEAPRRDRPLTPEQPEQPREPEGGGGGG